MEISQDLVSVIYMHIMLCICVCVCSKALNLLMQQSEGDQLHNHDLTRIKENLHGVATSLLVVYM